MIFLVNFHYGNLTRGLIVALRYGIQLGQHRDFTAPFRIPHHSSLAVVLLSFKGAPLTLSIALEKRTRRDVRTQTRSLTTGVTEDADQSQPHSGMRSASKDGLCQ